MTIVLFDSNAARLDQWKGFLEGRGVSGSFLSGDGSPFFRAKKKVLTQADCLCFASSFSKDEQLAYLQKNLGKKETRETVTLLRLEKEKEEDLLQWVHTGIDDFVRLPANPDILYS